MDSLDDFEAAPFTADGTTRTVYRKGTGPAVIVISEIPGITPLVADFARRVADIGCTAVMPHLFGTPGKEPSTGYELQSMVHACVSREFMTWARGKTSPITDVVSRPRPERARTMWRSRAWAPWACA